MGDNEAGYADDGGGGLGNAFDGAGQAEVASRPVLNLSSSDEISNDGGSMQLAVFGDVAGSSGVAQRQAGARTTAADVDLDNVGERRISASGDNGLQAAASASAEDDGGRKSDAHVATQEAIKQWRMPIKFALAGLQKCPVPPYKNRSVLHDYGIRCEYKDDKTGTCKGEWFCLASEKCRDAGTRVTIYKHTTSNATKHLKSAHGLASEKSAQVAQNAATLEERVKANQQSTVFQDNPSRFLKLEWVKAHIVHKFLPFSFMDDTMRAYTALSHPPDFPVASLNAKAVKHTVVELYDATKKTFTASLLEDVRSSPLPILTASIDLWKCKFSGMKYLGVRLFWISRQWVFRTSLLAVQQFKPSSGLIASGRLSEMVRDWFVSVLDEFQLKASDLFATVTDGGPDVRRCCNLLLDAPWEWCASHMLNMVMQESFGTGLDAAKTKNPGARTIFKSMKGVLEHMNKSDKAAQFFEEEERASGTAGVRKQVQAVPQRWVSHTKATCRFLERAEGYKQHWLTHEREPLPLDDVQLLQLRELYSLMSPISDAVRAAQSKQAPMAASALGDLVKIRLTLVNEAQPLTMKNPAADAAYEKKEEPSRESGGRAAIPPSRPVPEKRAHGSLQLVTQTTRALLADALDNRFFADRYFPSKRTRRDGELKHFPLFDMVSVLHPPFKDLGYVEKLVALDPVCTGAAEEVQAGATAFRDTIWARVEDLTRQVVEASCKNAARARSTSGQPESASKRLRTMLGQAEVESVRNTPPPNWESLVAVGMIGSTELEEGVASAQKSPREIAAEEVSRYRSYKVPPEDILRLLDASNVLRWWRDKGQTMYPHLAVVARSCLGVVPGSGVLEKDFSQASNLLNRRRSTMDPSFVEMVNFLHAGEDDIPTDVPEIPVAEQDSYIPTRLRNPVLQARLAALENGEGRSQESSDENEDDPEVMADAMDMIAPY
eukprot:jgi/Mesvir1/9451/Mv25710-RA.1